MKNSTLIAKQIKKDQWWIVTDGTKKIGNVEHRDGDYHLTVGNNHLVYNTVSDLAKNVDIDFQTPLCQKIKKLPYAQWPLSGKSYNDFYDVKRKIHIYTKSKNSKCYHAAGWFKVKMGDQWKTMFCPKYILIRRYQYTGPYQQRPHD